MKHAVCLRRGYTRSKPNAERALELLRRPCHPSWRWSTLDAGPVLRHVTTHDARRCDSPARHCQRLREPWLTDRRVFAHRLLELHRARLLGGVARHVVCGAIAPAVSVHIAHSRRVFPGRLVYRWGRNVCCGDERVDGSQPRRLLTQFRRHSSPRAPVGCHSRTDPRRPKGSGTRAAAGAVVEEPWDPETRDRRLELECSERLAYPGGVVH